MLTDALLIALLAGLAGVDLFDGLTHFHRPVVMGPLVGLILGDVYTGLLVGGTLELVWMGMVPLAGPTAERGDRRGDRHRVCHSDQGRP